MSSARRAWSLLAAAVAVGLSAAVLTAAPAGADTNGVAAAAPALRPGSANGAVVVVQEFLGVPATGVYDEATTTAVMDFQARMGIPVTGRVGLRTWLAFGGRASRSAARAMAPAPVDGKVCPTIEFTYGDGWGASRWHGAHLGMDMMGERGTPIFAVEDGEVIRAGVQSNGALRIVMQASSGPKYYYGHNSTHFVKAGDRVKAGDLIALMGDTGSPGAVHLHFEYWKSGGESAAVDPEPLLRRLCPEA